jgi:hypothetical protein
MRKKTHTGIGNSFLEHLAMASTAGNEWGYVMDEQIGKPYEQFGLSARRTPNTPGGAYEAIH